MKPQFSFALFTVLVVIGIILRVIPHIPNVAPITAFALVVSAYFGLRYSIPTVITTMFISDLFIDFYSWPVMVAVYASFIIAACLGLIAQKQKNLTHIATAVISSSLLFFIITNWAVWQFSGMYAHTFSGFMECYLLALPFLKYSLIGDVGYTLALGIIFEIAFRKQIVIFSSGARAYLSNS